MSKTILIVEGDPSQSRHLASMLESKGFRVEETLDGKGSLDRIRQDRPDLVLMAVDLSAGQNGYILCGKAKKDDDLRDVPLIIVGNPDGFAPHRKLRTRADDYVSKPIDEDALLTAVSGLIGLPEGAASDVADEVELSTEAEEITVDPDRLDEAFSDLTATDDFVEEDASISVEVPLEKTGEALIEHDDSDFSESTRPWEGSSLDDDEATHVGAPPSALPSPGAYTPMPADPNELRHLRSQVAELQATLDDTLARFSTLQGQVQEMEVELEQKSTELVTARATSSGASTRDTLALKEAANRKDKEILRLRGEINERDQEIVELREREVQLETGAAEEGDVRARLEAQLQTVTQRADQLAADKRRLENEVQQVQQEGRGAIARASAMEAEIAGLQSEVEAQRSRADAAEASLGSVRSDLEAAQRALANETVRAAEAREEVEALRSELTEQIDTFSAQAIELRDELATQKEAAERNEERATRLYARIRADEKLREKTKKALAVAQQLVEEQPAEDVDLDVDEAAG